MDLNKLKVLQSIHYVVRDVRPLKSRSCIKDWEKDEAKIAKLGLHRFAEFLP